MQELAQQVVSGLASGSIYASMALALVLIYRSMNVINFAQGEMAMFTTFIAWQLIQQGLPLWGAFAITIGVAFAGAVLLERIVIRPVERAGPLTIVIVTLGLLITFNGLAGLFWGYVIKSFPSPFPSAPITTSSRRAAPVLRTERLRSIKFAAFFRPMISSSVLPMASCCR